MGRQKRYHYLPVTLLRRFASPQTERGTIFQFNTQDGSCRKSTPKQVGHLPDYYRVDIPGTDPNIAEDVITQAEGAADKALRCIEEDPDSFGEGTDISDMLVFVGLMILRTPGFREWLNGYHVSCDERMLVEAVSTLENWERIGLDMKRAGKVNSDRVTYEQMKAFVLEHRYEIRVPKERAIYDMLTLLEPISRILDQRSWRVVRVVEGEGSFICSDNPVSLDWAARSHHPGPLGLLIGNTEVAMPLREDMCISGTFGGQPTLGWTDRRGVAIINRRTASRATRFLYAHQHDFLWMQPNGTIGNWKDYLSLLHAETSEHQSKPTETLGTERKSGDIQPQDMLSQGWILPNPGVPVPEPPNPLPSPSLRAGSH
jgi:hypothetical protein